MMMNHQDARRWQPANEEPRRLTLILNDPSAEWSEIRSAMRAKAKQGNGAAACTNYSLMNALSSGGGGGGDYSNCSRDSNSPPPKTNDDAAAAVREEPQQEVAVKKKEDADDVMPTQAQDTITPLTNRRASLSSQDSSKGSGGTTTRPSLRGHRQLSSRRPSNRRLQRGGSSRRLLMLRSSINNGSIRSITESSFNSSASSLNDSSFNLSGSTSKFGESTASAGGGGGRRQHLMHDLHGSINIMDFGISQRALTVASSTALDESSRSLDESALEVFDEEQRNKSGRGLLVSWQHDDSSASLRLIQSFRTRNNDDGSVRSEGDLDSFVDSYGFLDWPATREETEEAEGGKVGGGTIQEESIIEEVVEQQEEEETWNIEDYEGSGHSLDVAEHRLRHSTPSNPIAKTLKMFTRTRRASNASSTSSHEDSIDLSKIKESLLLTTGGKNNKQSMEEMERGGGGSNKQKKRGSMLPVGIFNKSPPTDGRSNVGKISSDDDNNEMTTRRSSSQEEIWKRKPSRETAIWVRDSDRDFDVGDLKTMYTNKPDTSCVKKRMSWNIFEGVVKNQSQPSSQRRSSTND